MDELFGILNVLDPEHYGDEEEFLERFGKGMPTLQQVQDLQVRSSITDMSQMQRCNSVTVIAVLLILRAQILWICALDQQSEVLFPS